MRDVRLPASGGRGKKSPGKEGWARVRRPEIFGNQGRMDTRPTGEETDCTSHKAQPWYLSQWLRYT